MMFHACFASYLFLLLAAFDNPWKLHQVEDKVVQWNKALYSFMQLLQIWS